METWVAQRLGQYPSPEIPGNVLARRAPGSEEEAAKETQESPFLRVILG